jgi:hypothetical protein
LFFGIGGCEVYRSFVWFTLCLEFSSIVLLCKVPGRGVNGSSQQLFRWLRLIAEVVFGLLFAKEQFSYRVPGKGENGFSQGLFEVGETEYQGCVVHSKEHFGYGRNKNFQSIVSKKRLDKRTTRK